MSDTISASVQGFTALVQQQAAAAQVAAAKSMPGTNLNLSSGSIFLAIFQAVAGIGLWLQGLALNLLLVARAATSTGSDLDSWMAQFQFTRIGGTTATCNTVQLTRFSTSTAAQIAPGGLVMTADGSEQFIIIADATQAAWNATAGGYAMAAGVATCQVTVQAVSSGADANVPAGTITAFASGIPGVDQVTNTGAAAGGSDAEQDGAFLARFWLWLQYLWRATPGAIQYAAQSVQPGLAATVVQNQDEAGNFKPGYFYVTVDDGSGYPPASLLAACAAQVETTRGAGMGYAVHAPAVVTVNVAATVAPAAGFTNGAVQTAAQSAAQAWIASMVLGQNLSYFKTGTAIENAAGVAELQSLTLNGAAADITATPQQKIVPGTITITVA